MAHLRKPLAVACALNALVLAVEAAGGVRANSLSLVMDAVHNLSDQMALGFLLLAYTLRTGLSGRFLWVANWLNSIGLLAMSGLLLRQALERMVHPQPVLGPVPLIVGLLAALGNWGVARALRKPSQNQPSIRLAYTHNLGDALLSLAPAGAGLCIVVFRRSLFDPLVAFAIGMVILIHTLRALVDSPRELLWPENVVCGLH